MTGPGPALTGPRGLRRTEVPAARVLLAPLIVSRTDLIVTLVPCGGSPSPVGGGALSPRPARVERDPRSRGARGDGDDPPGAIRSAIPARAGVHRCPPAPRRRHHPAALYRSLHDRAGPHRARQPRTRGRHGLGLPGSDPRGARRGRVHDRSPIVDDGGALAEHSLRWGTTRSTSGRAMAGSGGPRRRRSTPSSSPRLPQRLRRPSPSSSRKEYAS